MSGAAATKSIILGLIILATARLFVPFAIAHPVWMVGFLVLTSVTFSLFGFIIGIWADGFEKLQIVPMLIVTPLTFLGGSFYSINMLPPFWQKVTLFNPVVYLVSGFRWSFYGVSDVGVGVSLGMTLGVPGCCAWRPSGGSSGPATGSRRDVHVLERCIALGGTPGPLSARCARHAVWPESRALARSGPISGRSAPSSGPWSRPVRARRRGMNSALPFDAGRGLDGLGPGLPGRSVPGRRRQHLARPRR